MNKNILYFLIHLFVIYGSFFVIVYVLDVGAKPDFIPILLIYPIYSFIIAFLYHRKHAFGWLFLLLLLVAFATLIPFDYYVRNSAGIEFYFVIYLAFALIGAGCAQIGKRKPS